jgi:hypothetical protein
MPRAGWRKPESEQRLSDHISIGVLTRTYPPAMVDAAVASAGRQERRHRLLPARVVVYYVMAMALFSHAAYEEVMRSLVEGLAWSRRWRSTTWTVPTKAAIFQARVRLGVEPLRILFHRAVHPLGTPESRGVWFRSWRLMSVDGTILDVADTPVNEAAFGRPPHSRGEGSAFPQVRLAALAESGTHAIVDVALGPCTVGELSLAPELFRSLQPGMLCLADRLYFSYHLWQQASANGADLLWRARSNAVLPVVEELADGSYLSHLFATPKDRAVDRDGIPVRVIEYVLEAAGQPTPELPYRLITTILDPTLAPADELAVTYAERWELETAFDELKTHQRGPRLVLRSKRPEGVEQEIYGHLLTHFAIRALMHEAALEAEEDPDRLSFIRSLRVVRRAQTSGLFSP